MFATATSCVYLEEQAVWERTPLSGGDSEEDANGILKFHWHLLLQERDAEERKHILAELGHIKC